MNRLRDAHARPTRFGRGRTLVASLFAVAVGSSAFAVETPAASPAPGGFPPTFAHVMVIVMENQSLEDILVKNPAAKYILNTLTPAAGLAMKFYAPKRNSPTAYFAMSSGFLYTEGDGGGRWAGKCGPTAECSSDDETVYEQLTKTGRSWRIYSEDQIEPCQTTFVDKYWVGHNPAVWYTRLGPNAYTKTGDGSCLKHDVALGDLSRDIAAGTVPEYTMVVPDNCGNMHDECYPIQDRVMQGNAWLEKVLEQNQIVEGGLLAWARANDTLLVITFDEARLDTDREGCCPYVTKGGGGHIPTWVLGPESKVKQAYRSDVLLSNFSVLRTVQQNWGLPYLGHAADAATSDLSDFLILTPTKQSIPKPNPSPALGDGAPVPPSASAGSGPATGQSAAPGGVASSPPAQGPATGQTGLGPSSPTVIAAALIVVAIVLMRIRRFVRSSRTDQSGG